MKGIVRFADCAIRRLARRQLVLAGEPAAELPWSDDLPCPGDLHGGSARGSERRVTGLAGVQVRHQAPAARGVMGDGESWTMWPASPSGPVGRRMSAAGPYRRGDGARAARVPHKHEMTGFDSRPRYQECGGELDTPAAEERGPGAPTEPQFHPATQVGCPAPSRAPHFRRLPPVQGASKSTGGTVL